ncbi:MAG: hypothetical protein FJY73_01605 [Candidatus Eisenbacteria bacterium]|nr:hypothetical protein [Candidatus Eisenbacteria bacterium]
MGVLLWGRGSGAAASGGAAERQVTAMMRMLFALLIAALWICGCISEDPAPVSDTGTVVFLSMEGGFFGIVDDHGRRWDPFGLPEELQVDSLRVQFEGIPAERATFHMWGRAIDLTSITRLNGSLP